MRILVTGGLGKIGSRLCERISNQNNHEIIILDKEDTKSKLTNNIDVIKGDIRNYDISKIKDIDIIIHMAAQTSVNNSIDYPVNDASNNVKGTLNLLEKSKKLNIERFIYMSSAAVYGIPINLPITEEHITSPISPYGLSKLTGEQYSILYHNLYDLPVTSLRLFNVYGFKNSNDSYSGVITKFIDKVKKNENPIIYGDGNQTRDFIYIDDVISAIILTMENKNAIGEIINIGTGTPTKISELAKIITNILYKNIEPKFAPPKIGDIRDSYANVNKMKNVLNFEPEYSLEKGLQILINRS